MPRGRQNRLISPAKKNRAFPTGNALLYISLSYVDFGRVRPSGCTLFLFYSQLQFSAVCLNDPLIPVKAIFTLAAQVAGAIIELVDVDETVTLCHLAGGGGDQINAAPRGIAHQIHAVLDRLSHLLDVPAQIVNAIAVVDLAVLALHIVSTQTVLHHHHRQVVTVVDFVEGIAQTNGVDLPAPVGSLQVGVLLSGNDVAAHILGILMGGDAVGHIIAEGVEVHRALFQDVSVLGLLQDGDAVLGEPALHIAGILAAHLHIGAEPVGNLHLLLVGDHIGRVTGQRIMKAVEQGDVVTALASWNELHHSVAFLKRLGQTLENARVAAAITRTVIRIGAINAGIPPIINDSLSSMSAGIIRHARTIDEIDQEHERLIREYCQTIRRKLTTGHSNLTISILYYLDHSYAQPITMQTISEELEVPASRIISQFKKEVGITPLAYLNRIRMQHAAHSLAHSRAPIHEIAESVGIMDANYFVKRFKAEFQDTPSQYRAKYFR